jgi:hypothetical protein
MEARPDLGVGPTLGRLEVPNCDFYALRANAVAVLHYIYGETDCQVYEMASRPGEELRRFNAVADLLAAFDLGHGRASVLLQLYSPSMKGSFRIKRIDFDPARVKGPTWRYDACGWGTIQLYFGGIHENNIRPSHTNHNSELRAAMWEPTSKEDLGAVATWDWEAVGRISRAINRRIAKLGVTKHGSRPVLPAAWAAANSGALLGRI